MPELRLQTLSYKRKHRSNGNSKLDSKKVDWQSLSYKDMVSLVEKLVGPRPELPADLPKSDWTSQAIRVLEERYFLKNEDGKVIENVEEMCWRVAWELARAEVKFGKSREEILYQARTYYNLMVRRWFLPNSPTLANAGKSNGLQYSACYVIPVDDSLVGIFDGVKYQGIVHQSGGGTGFSFSRLRPAGSRVKSTMGMASGPISFMRIYNEATQQIKQGGMRRGANMGILRIDHPDIMEFIHCKEDGGITNFNISCAITDKFMEALAKDEEYELIDPHSQKVTEKLSARKVWDEIAQAAWKTGDPGLIFIDRINKGNANPIRADGWLVESTNPCVAGDTRVSTNYGLIKIKDLFENNNQVKLLLDKRLSEEKWGISQKIVYSGIKKVYELKTKEGYSLKLTGDHRIMTSEGWKKSQDLKKGEKIFISNRKGGFGKEGSLELGQVLGWLVGDGTMKATEAVLSFFGKEKAELAPRFATMVTELTEGMQKLNRAYPVGVGWIDDRDEARVGSTRLWRLVSDYGIRPGNKLVVPEKVFQGSEGMQRGFLQALFTADGHVSGTPENSVNVRLTSISLNLLKDVQKLLLNFGIFSKIYENRRVRQVRKLPDSKGGYKDYMCSNYHDLAISRENLWKFAREIAFLVEYKNMALIDKLHEYKETPYSCRFEARFDSLTYLDKQPVYDLSENLTHAFVANGIISHNCGEQPLYPFDACNLGSIFLGYFVKEIGGNKEVDWDKLKEVTHIAVRLLDSVIEMNPFPLPQIADTVRKIRRIGLGIGGWADMLVELSIPYDSQEALDLGQKIMKYINDEGHKASQNLANERGPFPLWKQSIYKNGIPIRNSTVTTIAPTGTIGILAGASGGIEPLFAIAYQHIVKSENRTLNFVNPVFEEVAKSKGFYSQDLMTKVIAAGTIRQISELPENVRKVFGTAHEITPDWHVKMQAAFQKNTDNAVSKTINLVHDSTVDEIKNAYMLAWDTNCNGITVFRDGCKGDQVLNLGVKSVKNGLQPEPQIVPQTIKPRPIKVDGATYQIETPIGSAYITVNHDVDGNPFEVFVTIGKAGSEVSAMAEALGRLISTTLRFGNHLPAKERAREIMHQMQGIGGGRSVGFGPNKVRSLPDAIAKAIGMHFGLIGYHQNEPLATSYQSQTIQQQLTIDGKTDNTDVSKMFLHSVHKDICPSCGEASLILEEGCKKCYSCGFSEC